MKSLVNTQIIGAQKSGTTSLYNYMRQHPNVTHSTVKELTYFIDDAVYQQGIEGYHSWFPKNANTRVVSSGHTHMLVSPEAPERVRQYNPNTKFIVLLRDPVERAWSAYNYAVANGWQDESIDFAEALQQQAGKPSDRTRYDTAYLNNGLYGMHLMNWIETFDKRRFHIIRSTDLRNNTDAVLLRLFQFLEISTDVKIDANTEHNKARGFRWKSVARFVHSRENKLKRAVGGMLPARARALIRGKALPLLNKANQVTIETTEMPEDVAGELRKLFADDAELLRTEFNFEF